MTQITDCKPIEDGDSEYDVRLKYFHFEDMLSGLLNICLNNFCGEIEILR